MSDLIPAIEFDESTPHDIIKPFAYYLKGIDFPHRLSEQQGKLILWVYLPEHVEIVHELFRRYQQGELSPAPSVTPDDAQHFMHDSIANIKRMPVTCLFLCLSVLGYLAVLLQLYPVIYWLSFQGVYLDNAQAVINHILQGQVWRVFTPVFLHFSWVHIAFNAVIFWFLAKQIETKEGSLALCTVTLILAAASNTVQFYLQPYHLFGGLSGVVYGLLTYCWVSNKIRPGLFFFPEGLLWVAAAMMLIGFSGVTGYFGLNIANWAHLSGFCAGILLALFQQFRRQKLQE